MMAYTALHIKIVGTQGRNSCCAILEPDCSMSSCLVTQQSAIFVSA